MWRTREAIRFIHTNADPILMRIALDFAGGIRLDHKEYGHHWTDTIILPNRLAKKMYMRHFSTEQEIEDLPPFEQKLTFYADYEEDKDGVRPETLKNRDTVANMKHNSGNVIAISLARYEEMQALFGPYEVKPEAWLPIFPHDPNTTRLSFGELVWQYVHENTKRIRFGMALTIHPALFAGNFLNAVVPTQQEVLQEK